MPPMADPPPPAQGPRLLPTVLGLLVLAPLMVLSPWTASAGLILLCGVFVAFEFALVKAGQRELQRDVEAGVPGAALALAMKADMNAMLAACQFGITITSLGLTLALEPALHHLLDRHASQLLLRLATWVDPRALSVGAAMVLGSLLHVTFGELVPKSFALLVPRGVLYRTVAFMRLFRFSAIPFIASCNGAANLVVRLLTGKDPHTDVHHDEAIDLREALVYASSSGQIAPKQLRLIKNVLAFAERTAREVMTPASKVVALRLATPWEEVKQQVNEQRYSRYPVIDGDWQHLVGYVRHIEVLHADTRGQKDLRALVRPIERRPETVAVSELNLFQGSPLVALYDEHDVFVGLLTAEDVVEEIVGEIYDETDERGAQAIQRLPEGKVRLSGALLLDQVAEHLSLREELSAETDVDTIGGLVLKRLGRQPVPGDQVEVGPWRAVVEEASGFRIVRLRFEPGHPGRGLRPGPPAAQQ